MARTAASPYSVVAPASGMPATAGPLVTATRAAAVTAASPNPRNTSGVTPLPRTAGDGASFVTPPA
jgi:hypothetical protein